MTEPYAAGPYAEGPRTEGLRSGQVAAAAGVNLQTLRYYERRGLVAEPQRTLGGHRLYPPETVTLLRVIKTAQRLGFTLTEVAELLDVAWRRASPGTPLNPSNRAGLRQRVGAKLVEVEQRIADLTLIRDALRQAADAGCDDLVACAQSPDCPLPLAELAEEGRYVAVDP